MVSNKIKLSFLSLILVGFNFVFCKNIKQINIKVLLGEYDTKSKKIFNVVSNGKIIVKTKASPKSKSYKLKFSKFQIMVKNNILYARNKKNPFKKVSSNKLYIKSPSHDLTINGVSYDGDISFKLSENHKKLFIINKLGLEDYVYAVLLAESYQTWPHNMQKIQAIISRTYAVRQIREKRKKKKKLPYDIMRNTFHQRYNGNHDYQHLRKAVDETKNLILTYNDDVVLTMFDACCGGSIPAYMKCIDFKKAPYLARKIPCNFCKNYKLYRWKRKVSVPRFLNYIYQYRPISKKLSKKRELQNIVILEKNKTGIVNKIKLQQSKNKKVFISGKDLWMSMSNILRSQNFTIKKDNNNIIINGKGFGHQIGFCQRGGRELVARGWPIKKILEFYYPKTKVARLKVKYT